MRLTLKRLLPLIAIGLAFSLKSPPLVHTQHNSPTPSIDLSPLVLNSTLPFQTYTICGCPDNSADNGWLLYSPNATEWAEIPCNQDPVWSGNAISDNDNNPYGTWTLILLHDPNHWDAGSGYSGSVNIEDIAAVRAAPGYVTEFTYEVVNTRQCSAGLSIDPSPLVLNSTLPFQTYTICGCPDNSADNGWLLYSPNATEWAEITCNQDPVWSANAISDNDNNPYGTWTLVLLHDPNHWDAGSGYSGSVNVEDITAVRTAPGYVTEFTYEVVNTRQCEILNTPVGSSVAVRLGDVTITFDSVTVAGNTTIDAIDPATVGEVPGGFAASNTVAYEISTTAVFRGPVTIAFVVSGQISEADFNNLIILHNENGILTDITTVSPPRDYATRTISATTNSFSPFYLVRRGQHVTALFDQTRAYKGGSTVPIKIRLLDGSNTNISSASIGLTARSLRFVGGNTTVSVIDSGNANPDSNFRFDVSLGGYIFNLSTRGLASGSYVLSFYVGSDHSFFYNVRFEVK